ncbi:MFS transporter [Rhodopila globiformis]|uniref:MFS transporter n=1 Tax=Rhodopila globiformis TaxID=1071 RepID=A0A2S6NMJ9_RHOGL|nr:MFS transporter [Rhodopila globiformis]PPQ37308.1 MFS transporter [Rhodopila globiformis]
MMSTASSAIPAYGGLSEAEHDRQLRRALIASTIGTTIEWYDFLLYGTVTGLVFGKLFFPGSEPLIGVLQAFGVFFIGFVGRPIGAAIFGHFGDRIGRKATLITTLLLTGLATVAVGLVPSYAMIGVWGAVLLTVIRLVQGIGVGGEWGGSVLLAMEWSKGNHNRGHIASWPQFGAPAGLFLANSAVLLFSWLSGDQFLVWGWRIPFLISIIMVGVGLWIRMGILETPVFQKILDEDRVERVPVLEVLKRQPRQVLLTALLRLPEQAPGYLVATFIFTYGTNVLGMSRNFLLLAVILQTVLGFMWVTYAGRMSDTVGRKRMYMSGCVMMGIFGFLYYALLDTGNPVVIFLMVALSLLPVMTLYGPEAALIAEAFSPRLRYSGASLGYQLASIIAGGPAPFIATWLVARYHSSLPVAIYIMITAIIGLIATALLEDYTNKDISAEYENV